MVRFALLAATLGILGFPCGDVFAAFVGASVQPTRNNCAAFGDALCAGGQVHGDPALAPEFQSITDALPGSLAVADKVYFDPRIGTANSTFGSASAGLGVLRTQSAATVSSQPPLATGTANLMQLATFSRAQFQDTITVMPVSPSLVGASGFMTASIRIDGDLQASAVNTKSSGFGYEPVVAYADWRLQVQVGNTFLGNVNIPVRGFFGAEGVDHLGVASIIGGPLGEDAVVTFSAPIVFGAPTDLQVIFGATTLVTVSSAVLQPLTSGFTFGSAESIYMSTATWSGIESVRAGSATVPFSVSSATGIDYAQPVPEPRTAVLFAAGLLLLAWRGVRGARRRVTGIEART